MDRLKASPAFSENGETQNKWRNSGILVAEWPAPSRTGRIGPARRCGFMSICSATMAALLVAGNTSVLTRVLDAGGHLAGRRRRGGALVVTKASSPENVRPEWLFGPGCGTTHAATRSGECGRRGLIRCRPRARDVTHPGPGAPWAQVAPAPVDTRQQSGRGQPIRDCGESPAHGFS